MDLFEILQQVARRHSKILSRIETGCRMQGQVYYLEYSDFSPPLTLSYHDRTATFVVTEKDPTNLVYCVWGPYLAGQLEFLKNAKSKMSALLLAAFIDEEKRKKAEADETQILLPRRAIDVPSERELISFIEDHLKEEFGF